MAINKKLIHFKTKAAFEAQLAGSNILDTSIVFIQDANLIWTHGTYYCLPSDDVVISNGIEPDNDQDLWIDTSDNTTAVSVEEAPTDGNMYVRKNGTWVVTLNEVYVGETEPTNGEVIWINPNTDEMKYFNGIQWVTVSGKTPEEETLIISLASNQTNPDSNLNGAVVNVRYLDMDHKQAWIGEALSFNIPSGTEYTIEYSDITDSEGNKLYTTPTAETYTAVDNEIRTLSRYYNCCKLTITRTNNQSASMEESTSAVITYSSYSQTVNFTSSTNSVTITIPYDISYTIAFNGTITNYRTPANITGTSSSTAITETGSYDSEKLTVNVSGVSSGFTVTVNGQSQTATSETYYIPYDTAYTISASSVKGYNKEISESSITASQQTRTVIVAYTKMPNGVYICDNTGTLTTVGSWNTSNNSSAIGVAVLSDNCSFVIGKTQSEKAWSSRLYDDTVSGIKTTTDSSTAKTDYKGKANSSIVGGLTSGEDNAFNWASGERITVNGTTLHGYIGALGEWQTAYNNKSSIDSAFSKIGGTMRTHGYYWTSTQYSSVSAWMLYWNDGYVSDTTKDRIGDVRAFYPLP